MQAGVPAKIPDSMQDTVPYDALLRSGVSRTGRNYYTKTLSFTDINYQLAQEDEQARVFEWWCRFFNYFGPNVPFQLTCSCRLGNQRELRKSIDIQPRGDKQDGIRKEYADMLKSQMAKGNNAIVQERLLTFGTTAFDMQSANHQLESIQRDIIANFKRFGVSARPLDGIDRLKALHAAFHPDGRKSLKFSWADMAQSGLSTVNYILPTSFDFGTMKDRFRLGKMWGAAFYVSIAAAELSDELVSDLLNAEMPITLNLHVQPMDQPRAIKKVKQALTDVNSMKIDEQKKSFQAGYGMDILPPDIETYGDAAKELLKSLQFHDERMFLVTITIINTAETRAKLEQDITKTEGILSKYNCDLVPLDNQQEQGFISNLPLGVNELDIVRGLNTSAAAIFTPFVSKELFQPGEAMYYGLNAVSKKIIMVNRKNLHAPNGLILGKTGYGKSMAAKREMVNVFLVTTDDVLISDPSNEYGPLIEKLGGQVIHLSASNHNQHINLMDVPLRFDDMDAVLALKSDFLLSVMESIKGDVSAREHSLIDRGVRHIYRSFFANPSPENIPILQDFYEFLLSQKDREAQEMATELEIYVIGSQNYFNHRTNVNLQNRIVCYDYKSLGKGLKKLAMLALQDQVLNRVTDNQSTHRRTWYYEDEFHLMLKEPATAAYSVEFWKMFRKWGGIPTGITQNVTDLLRSPEIGTIFDNSDFVLMLNQSKNDADILAQHLGIAEKQIDYFTGVEPGHGLLSYGNTIIPFEDDFPKDTELYRLMTTKPEEVSS